MSRIKNYRDLGAGVNVDFGSDFGPDEILQYAQAAQGMSNAKAANARADAQLAIAQSNQAFIEQTRAETEAASNALNTWGSYGIDTQTTGAWDPTNAFKKSYDYDTSFEKAWQGYKSALGVKANKAMFENHWRAGYVADLQRAGRRFKAMRETERVNQGIRDNELGGILDRHMQNKYGGIELYEQLSMMGEDASGIMGFKPVIEPQSWKEAAARLLTKESFKDEEGNTYGGGLTKLGAALTMALPGAVPAWGAYKAFGRKGGQFKTAKDKFLAEADEIKGKYKPERKQYEKIKDKKTGKMVNKLDKKGNPIVKKVTPASGLTGGKDGTFMQKYGMLKSEAFDKKGKATDAFIKRANMISRRGTTLGKQLGFGRSYGLSAMGGGLGSKAAETLAEKLGGGEKTRIAASLTGGVGGAVGGHKLMKKIMQPSTMKRLMPHLKKHAPKLAAKVAMSATATAVPEAISTALGLGGLAWSAYDIYKLAKEIPAIADVIFTEE